MGPSGGEEVEEEASVARLCMQRGKPTLSLSQLTESVSHRKGKELSGEKNGI